MKISEKADYSMFLMGQTNIEIENLIAKKWESHDFADQAYNQIAIQESPDREVYQFILGVTLGNWDKCSQALEFIECNLNGIDTYQQIALRRMRAMINIAEGKSIEAMEILENVYKDIPRKYSWLKRTVAIDIRNVAVQYVMLDHPELIEKNKEWQSLLLKLPDYNPLLDGNDSDSLNTVINEFFEVGTKLESTTRFSSSIREVLQLQFRNLFLSIRLGYNTGARVARRNIGLILYQWAKIHNDPFLYSSSLYEFIENGNKAEVEKIFRKHSDVLVRNRSNAILLFDKVRSLSDISLLQGIELMTAERIYDFLGNDECEVIDKLLINTLSGEYQDLHSLEMKRLAMKVFVPQSNRISPAWFVEFSQNKLKKNDEHWWFYLDLFRTLGSIDASKCNKEIILELVKTILNYFRSNQTLEETDGLRVLYNLVRYSEGGFTLVDDFLFEKYGSRESAFNKYPLYFTAYDHPVLLDEYHKYIHSAIQEFKNSLKQTEQRKVISISSYTIGDVLQNIIRQHFSEISETCRMELADASVNYCLNPYLEATKKRSVLNLIKIIAEKTGIPEFWKKQLQDMRDRFDVFSKATDDRVLAAGIASKTLGALAGSTYIAMGGNLSPSLWNHIWRDKVASYDNRIDCVEAMSEIAEIKTKYSLMCFFVLSELVNDEFFMVSHKALFKTASLSEFPEDIVPMLCQSIFNASYSGDIRIRIAATYSIKKISNRIENHFWHDQLETRLKELEKDDCRPVSQQALIDV